MDWAELRSKLALFSGLLEKIPDRVLDIVISSIHSEISLVVGLEGELAKLKRTGERISALLRDAEERRHIEDDHVLLWLRNLRDVALDAEDIIDEFETQLRLSSAPPRADSAADAGRKKRPWYAIASAPSPLILFRRRVAKEIVEINEKFESISKDRERLRLRRGEAPWRSSRMVVAPPTAAILPEKPQILGRDGDKKSLVDLLVPDPDGDAPKKRGLPVIAIYGMAGLGKTTLAKYVFDDERVKKHFKEKMIWICATKGFDVVRMTKEILESLTGEACNLSNFNLMQCKVLERLMGEPFLLVLDDVRDDGPGHWEKLRVCLPGGGGGSGVLITTRSEDVARRMRTVDRECLKGLPEADCLVLFEQRAFPGGGLDQFPNLKRMGAQIVRKCQGSPLAAISLGGLLHNEQDEAEWSSVLNETEVFQQNDNDILPKLKLTYDHLPLHLKKCFAFCSVFPDGHLFDRDVLVRLWIAEGFIERRGTRRLETIGSRYFEELLWRSFFQVSDSTEKQTLKYKIPSLFHDLAESMSKHECFRMVDNGREPDGALQNARHSTLLFRHSAEDPVFTKFHKYKRLRTFSVKGDQGVVAIMKLPSDLFKKLRCLRVLDLSDSTISELPDSIGELKLLRYLGLSKTLIEWLPESVATLCNLQTLELNDCYKLRGLPECTSSLVNLRHLDLHLDQHRVSHLMSMPPGIGELTSLETLSRFTVGTKQRCGISEIRNLNLRGELWISKLENVVRPEDAAVANLQNKRYIDNLTLQWSDHDQHAVQHVDREDMIERLRPPTQLRYLRIDGYYGRTVPVWLGDVSFSDLVTLRLSYCKRWESLQSLGLLPALKELVIEGMHSMGSIEYQFPQCGRAQSFKVLEKLTLWDLPALGRWSLTQGVMPHLSELYVSHCPALSCVPYLPTSLTKLAIKDCRALSSLTLPCNLQDLIVEACDWKVLDSVSKLSSLSSLSISQIPSPDVIQESFLQPLTSLKRLEIKDCKGLVSINGLPVNLRDFRLYCCHELTFIPRNLYKLTSLQHLEIHFVPRVLSLPQKGVPSSLQCLAISGCPFLEWRCQKDQGKDWPKIKDIFYVEIGSKKLSDN